MKNYCAGRRAIYTQVVLITTLLLTTGSLAAQDFEAAVTFKSADILSADILENKNYQIDGVVTNDGFLNSYTVESEFGSWTINSERLLKIRLTELLAMIQMRTIKDTESRDEAINEDVKEVKQGFGNLVEDPGAVMKGAASGVKKMFKLGGEAWKSRHTRDEDESSLKSLGNIVSGFDKAKRQYAAEFGVDPYSSNKALHQELDRVARSASHGSLISSAAKMLIPGGLGLMVSAANLSLALNELLTTKSEVEMRIINRDKLTALGIDRMLIERFLDDKKLSTTHKTYLTGALETLENVAGKDLFLSYSLAPPSEDIALFRTVSALSYAWYHKKISKLDRFSGGDSMPVAAINSNNRLILIAPLDHLLWTEVMASLIEPLDQLSVDESVDGKELWLTGTASARAIAAFDVRNWVVKAGIEPEYIFLQTIQGRYGELLF